MMRRGISIATAVVAGALTLLGQTSLESLVREAQAGWLLGRWVGTTQQGERITIQFQWALDRHIVLMRTTMGELNILGIVSAAPFAETAEYISFDNRGGRAKGTWDVVGEDLVLRLEGTSGEGNSWKAAVVFSPKGSNRMEVRLHSVDEWGYLIQPARGTVVMEKQPVRARRQGSARAADGN